MAENFNTYLEQIDFETWREICITKGVLQRFASGEEFVSIGKVGQYIGFIQSGALKYVAVSEDGNEHVMGFVYGGGMVADWPFCLYGQKAHLAIVAVSDCEIYCVPSKDVKELMDTNPNFKNIVMHSTEALFTTVYDRYVALYTQTPQQRYNDMISRYPDIFVLYSLRDIASFLNITPTHLSRLRKNI